MAKTSKLLQLQDIRIRDVGCQIMILSQNLKTNYSEESLVPTHLLGDGKTDDIINELFGESSKSKSKCHGLANLLCFPSYIKPHGGKYSLRDCTRGTPQSLPLGLKMEV